MFLGYERWDCYLAKLLTSCHPRYFRRDCTFLVSTFGLVAPHPIDSSTLSILNASTLVFSCAAMRTRLSTPSHAHAHNFLCWARHWYFGRLIIPRHIFSHHISVVITYFRQIDCWMRCFSALLLLHFFLYILPYLLLHLLPSLLLLSSFFLFSPLPLLI